MPYLIIDLNLNRAATSIWFESALAAEAELQKAQAQVGAARISLASDCGEYVSIRGDDIVGFRIEREVPPEDEVPPVDARALSQRLGVPYYDGPNAFAGPDFLQAYSPETAGTSDRVTVWMCRSGPDLQMCFLTYQETVGWRYSPCAIHRPT